MFIDSDAHIDECPDTWSYFPESMIGARPAEMTFVPEETPTHLRPDVSRHGITQRGLLIDGQLYRRRVRVDESTKTTAESRELRDVPARLKHMDELGIETQILYPTSLLSEVTERPEVEVAICESYNRWLADRCSESGGRLQWPAMLPLLSIPDALKEMRRVKAEGAVGILKRGIECGERRAASPYFYPVYELAQELDLPICMHTGSPYSGFDDFFSVTKRRMAAAFNVQDALWSLLLSKVYEKFPRLRFGFIEAASAWVPYVLYAASFQEIHRSGSAVGEEKDSPATASRMKARYEEILQQANFYITCEALEDLPLIVSQIGDNNLMVGTDYGHGDRSAILYGHRYIEESTDLKGDTTRKLVDLNGRKFYGL